jgi:hypothetical protein
MNLDFRLSDLGSRGKEAALQNTVKTMAMIAGLASLVESPLIGAPLVLGSGATMANGNYMRFLRRVGKDITNVARKLRYSNLRYTYKMKRYGI